MALVFDNFGSHQKSLDIAAVAGIRFHKEASLQQSGGNFDNAVLFRLNAKFPLHSLEEDFWLDYHGRRIITFDNRDLIPWCTKQLD